MPQRAQSRRSRGRAHALDRLAARRETDVNYYDVNVRSGPDEYFVPFPHVPLKDEEARSRKFLTAADETKLNDAQQASKTRQQQVNTKRNPRRRTGLADGHSSRESSVVRQLATPPAPAPAAKVNKFKAPRFRLPQIKLVVTMPPPEPAQKWPLNAFEAAMYEHFWKLPLPEEPKPPPTLKARVSAALKQSRDFFNSIGSGAASKVRADDPAANVTSSKKKDKESVTVKPPAAKETWLDYEIRQAKKRIHQKQEAYYLLRAFSKAIGVDVWLLINKNEGGFMMEGAFGKVVSVRYEDPATGTVHRAVAKYAINNEEAMKQIENEGAILCRLKEAGCTRVVEPLLCGAKRVQVRPHGFTGVVLLLEYARCSLADEAAHRRVSIFQKTKLLELAKNITSEQEYKRTVEEIEVDYDELVRLASEFVTTVQAVNAAGVLHADVKPDNALMIRQPGRQVVACDFGTAMTEDSSIACSVDVGHDQKMVDVRLWRVDQLAAHTPEYEQPERLRVAPNYVGYDFDGWAAMMGVLEIVGLKPKLENLADELIRGQMSRYVGDSLKAGAPLCPDIVVRSLMEVVDRATRTCYHSRCHRASVIARL